MSSRRNSKPGKRRLDARPLHESPPTLLVDETHGPHSAILRLCQLIESIPPGRVCTYGELAAGIGWPRHARLVGRFLAESALAESIPWHRVVGAGGQIRPRKGDGPSRQRSRLEKEGVLVTKAGRVRIASCLWSPNE